MRIAMVSEDVSPLPTSGTPDTHRRKRHVAELSAALSRAGHAVTVYTRREDSGVPERVETVHGFCVVQVAAGPAETITDDEALPAMGTFARFLETEWAGQRPDVAHAHSWTSGVAAQLAARDLGVPSVQTFPTLAVTDRDRRSTSEHDRSTRLRLERVLTKGAHHVVATSSEQVAALTRMGLHRTRTSVVPPGVDVEHFTVAGFETGPARGGPYRIVTAGRPVPDDGFDVAVAALSLLPDTVLVVAGGVADDEAAAGEIARLRALADRLGVGDRVQFPGPVTRDEMPALLHSADVALCPAAREPFGHVALEAMACGRPVVASAVGSLRDIVVDGVTGVLVPPRDPRAVAAAVRELLSDPVQHGAFGVAGRDRAATRYSWERAVVDLVGAYGRAARLCSAESGPVSSRSTHSGSSEGTAAARTDIVGSAGGSRTGARSRSVQGDTLDENVRIRAHGRGSL